MRKKILMVVILCFIILNLVKVSALSPQILISHHSYDEETKTSIANNKEEKGIEKKRSILGELKYRLFEKDTRDLWDYLLLAIFVVGLLIVMVLMNTHYYVVKIPKEKKRYVLEENDLKLVEKLESKKETNKNYYKKRNYKKKDE